MQGGRMNERMEIEGCSLSTVDLADRRAAWAQVEPAVVGRRRTGTGISVRFRGDAGVRGALQALVDAETHCCGWAVWRLAEEDGAPVLEVTGAPARIDDL